ncbi:uncharacterized protein LOC128883493 [Hylaeus volcanicus]|uniref:uncharacterized protein LOC128883493 n=1 Tax=Hylaeus volcanicus TaxID=313075 RepID=UPI0023B857B0|nr:uncharacterized protein LOC128883493 [Hylaeus volcanicus]
MTKKKQIFILFIYLDLYWIQNIVTMHRRIFENKLGYYAPITVDILSSPDVGIVNDLISVDDAVALDLSEELNVTFRVAPSDVYHLTNAYRYNFNTSWAKNCPEVTWKVNKNASYTILLIDMDYPWGRDTSHKTEKNQFIHWLATHIEDPHQIESTPIKYISPKIPEKSNNSHRYVFLLLEENNKSILVTETLKKKVSESGQEYIDRENFNLTYFQNANNLSLVTLNYFISNF